MWIGDETEGVVGSERAQNKRMDKHALCAHLMGIFVPIVRGEDNWITVWRAWAKECDRLGLPEEAQKHRDYIERRKAGLPTYADDL